MHHGVPSHLVGELGQLLPVRELLVQEQVADLHVACLHGKLVNGVSAVQEDALCTINERNL